MSNYTDGKKALGLGDFPKAEAKLLKALDNRPNDGELWWAVMLCKYGFRNDGELTESLKSEFERAARDGSSVPATPFDSKYCKNALAFDTNGKRRAFVTSLRAELSDIWAAERGTPLKTKPIKAAKAPRSRSIKAERFTALTYAAVGISAVGGALTVYGMFALSRSVLWCGFIVFLVFAVAAMVLRRLTVRAGGNARFAFAIVIGIFAAVCVGMFIAGYIGGNRNIMIISATAVAVVVMASLFFMGHSKFASRYAERGGKSSRQSSRDPYKQLGDGEAAQDMKYRKKTKSAGVEDEYKDDYD